MIDRLPDLPPRMTLPETPRDRNAPNDELFARMLENGSREGAEPHASAEPPPGPDGMASTCAAPSPTPEPTSMPVPAATLQATLEETTSEVLAARSTQAMQAGGREQLVVYPWQLRAHAGLSYAHGGAGGGAGSAVANAPALSTTDGVGTSSWRDPAMAEVGYGSLPTDRVAARAIAPVAAESSLPASAATERTARLTPTSVAASGETWPQRLLRWIADRDAGQTIWIRDYALAPEAARPLVADLLRESTAQGVSLRRVMLNGHELWRAPSHD
jgi:hypothetical protein